MTRHYIVRYNHPGVTKDFTMKSKAYEVNFNTSHFVPRVLLYYSLWSKITHDLSGTYLYGGLFDLVDLDCSGM